MFKSDFLNILDQRGFIHQSSDIGAIDQAAATGALVAYAGYDCTAPSLHVGHLMTLMMLYWLQHVGHKPIVLLGGATTLVGDPSGKDKTRKILTKEQIAENCASISPVFSKILHFGPDSHGASLLNNDRWLHDLGYLEMLRSVGRHLSVNRMLSADSIRLRLERRQEMSFIEFNYMVLQAYDFVYLAKHFNCNLQLGGSDQWGNIVSGIDLARRLSIPGLYGLTTSLLTTSSGAKMGKTVHGAVWLNPDMCTPYDYWQYWRNVEDADVGRFARLFTTLPLSEISRMESLQGTEINEAKKILATEATTLLHGQTAAMKVAAAAKETFENKNLSSDLPTITIPHREWEQGMGLLTALVRSGLAQSKGEARRLIQAQAIRLNGTLVQDEKRILGADDLRLSGQIKLSLGKKRHLLLKPETSSSS